MFFFFPYKVKLELDCISNRERSLLNNVSDFDPWRTSRIYTVALTQILKLGSFCPPTAVPPPPPMLRVSTWDLLPPSSHVHSIRPAQQCGTPSRISHTLFRFLPRPPLSLHLYCFGLGTCNFFNKYVCKYLFPMRIIV